MSPITLPLDYVEVTLWACGDQSAVGEGETRMATGKAEGKSGFLQEYLVKHPDAAKEAIDAAWQEAGHEGTISTSLIRKVREDLKQAGKGKSWPREARGGAAGGGREGLRHCRRGRPRGQRPISGEGEPQ